MTIGQRGIAFWRDCCGATAVEFAFVIGPLLLLLVGTIEVGRMMWAGHALDEVAINAARCMGIRAPGCTAGELVRPDLVVAYVVAAASSWGIVVTPADVSLETGTGCAGDTGFVRVGLSVGFVSVLPGLGARELQSEACFPSQF